MKENNEKKLKSFESLSDFRTKEVMKEMLGALNETRIELKNEKEQSENYLKIAGVIIIVLDLKGKVILINKKGCEVLGREEKNIVGKNWFENFLPVKTHKEIKKVFRKIMLGQKKAVEFFENPIIDANGQERLIAWHNSILKDRQGKNYAILSSGEDITQKKADEVALKSSELWFSTTLQSIGDGAVATDLFGQIKFVNAVAQKITGWTQKEAAGKKMSEVFDLVNERNGKKIIDPVSLVLRHGKIVGLGNHTILKSKTGSLIPIEDSAAPIKDQDGKIIGVILVFHDVTEKRKAENLLQESEEKFRYIFSNSPVGMSLTFLDGRVNTNRALNEMLGYSQTEMKNKKWQDITYPDDIKLTETNIESLKAGKQKIAKFVKRFFHKNGSLVWVELTSFLRRNKAGQPLYLISVLVDITEKKRVAKALEESENRYRITTQKTGQLIYEYVVDSGEIFWSGAIKKVTGYPEKEFNKKNIDDWLKMIHPEDRKKANAELEKARLAVDEYDVEYRFCKKNGKYIFVEDHGIFMASKKGAAERMYGVMEDISERKKVELKLIESEEKFAAAFHASPNMVVITRMNDGKILEVNEVYSQLLGYSHAESVGKTTLGLKVWNNPADRKIFIANLKKFGQITNFETVLRCKNGYLITVLDSARLITLRGEECILSSIHDITKRKEAEEKLKESEEKYSSLVEESNDAIILIQKDKLVFLNQKMSELVGYSVEECLDKDFLYFVAPEDHKIVLKRRADRAKGKKVEPRYEFNLVDRLGRYIPVEVNVTVINFQGQSSRLAIIRDMTKAKENEKMKSEFVSVTSHQMRTPLTGIKWFTELLLADKAGVLSEKQKDYMQQVQISNERMIKLVDDLLNVSRIESGEKFKIVQKKEDIVKIFKQIIQAQKIIAEKKKIKIVITGNLENNLKVSVDKDKISLALQNLLDNAIKYSPDNSVININYRQNKNDVVFSVADHGVGIPKKQQHLIFERFFRADNVLTTQSGTGLGLYIAKYIVEQHGGKIWFESEEDNGSTFFVSLPIK